MTFYSGALAPEAFRCIVTSPVGGPDLTTIVSAQVHVRRPTGGYATWSGVAISQQTARSLMLTYSFLVGDLPSAGDWYAVPYLFDAGGGRLRGTRVTFPVEDELPP